MLRGGKAMDNTSLQLKLILENHKGSNNAIKSCEIAEELGIDEDATHAKTRQLILDCMKAYDLPLVANNNGYYLIDNKADFIAYIKSLDKRINEITDRKRIITDNYLKSRHLDTDVAYCNDAGTLTAIILDTAERVMPKSVIEQLNDKNECIHKCPTCGMVVEKSLNAYCNRCGQKLSWVTPIKDE